VTPPLFLLDPLPTEALFVLAGDEGRHAATVKRLTPDEIVLVGDGRGAVLTCEVRSVARDQLELAVVTRREHTAPAPRLTVVQALPKGERAELAVEILTELGVDEIVPWAASRAITRWDGDRGAKAWARWQRTAREAAKQSRRLWLPVVAELAPTARVAARLQSAALGLVLHEDAERGIAEAAVAGLDAAAEIVLVVGPEGGISPDELAEFEAAGALAVRLGDSVLRTSTAGAAGLAALNTLLGRWGVAR
jgi:16S rRNA (uracil1498-N3)-methyltransferase